MTDEFTVNQLSKAEGFSASQKASLEIDTQTKASPLTTTPTGIESIQNPSDQPVRAMLPQIIEMIRNRKDSGRL